MNQEELARLERRVNDEILTRFPAGTVQRVALVRGAGDPLIGPDELLVRVFVGLPAGPGEPRRGDSGTGHALAGTEESLQSWAAEHETAMRRLRRELSWRLPPATLLEFTIDKDGDRGAGPRIVMPHDPKLASEPVPPREIVQTALAILRARYVFPDRAAQATAEMEGRIAAGEYDDLGEEELADRLTTQLYAICADKHLQVHVHPEHRPLFRPEPADREKARQEMRSVWRLHNFGIHRVERLEGNVGYIDVRSVALPQNAGAAIAAAMELVSGTYALIFDLRRNGGGSPEGVAFWCSYLFDGPGTHLNDIFEAESGKTRQFWSASYVPGSRYVGKPVYLLSSHETFSGGEDFCYTLQALGRAQLIGETTGGGAHPTATRPLSATMAISVPFARSVNPITGTNWEGTGVVPDVSVAAEQAHDVAYAMALRHVLTLDPPPPVHEEATQALARLSPEDLGT